MAPVAWRSALQDATAKWRPTVVLWQRRAWHRLGASAIVLPLALASSGVLATWDNLNQRAIRALEAGMGTPAARPVPVAAMQAIGARDDARRIREHLLAFRDGLPLHDGVGEALEAIVKAAEARHVQLAHGEYREQLDDTGAFSSYEMVFPVTADPAALQGFIADVLRAQPFLALVHVRAQRSATNPAQADVRMQFVLFTRSPGTQTTVKLSSAAKLPEGAQR